MHRIRYHLVVAILLSIASVTTRAALFSSYVQWINNESLMVKARFWTCGAVALALLQDSNGKPYNPSDFKIVAEHWKNDSYFIKRTGEYQLEAESFAARFNSATHRITLYKKVPKTPNPTSTNATTGNQTIITIDNSEKNQPAEGFVWQKVRLGDYMKIVDHWNNRPCWGFCSPGPKYGSLNMNS